MPFNSLPQDVAQIIFEHTLENKPRVHPLQPPLLLTQTTRHWRDLALSTPSLWANFSFGGLVIDSKSATENARAYDDEAPVQRPREELLELWLARSGVLPLHFALDFKFEDEAGARIMRLLLTQSHRWRNVKLTFSTDALVALDQAPIYPLLQTLTLSNSGLGDGAEHDISIGSGKVPILRRVTLHGFTHTQVHLPWHQLTHLDFFVTWGINDTLERT
uniref:F-box domain-containing protein n=1 Tax=Mycena chlorophos TaxID=658473 RepID=A0ABQ0L568_MYCCL|nr:predicted protein [Mycena chlorophos]